MKITFNLFSFLFVAGLSFAQTNISTSENYIYTKNCLNEDCTKKTEAVQYSDGLGRAKQTIAIKATPSGKDIVTPTEYDAFGRQAKAFLPIPQSGTQNGALYADPKANSVQSYGSDPYFYSYTQLENSPAAKVLSTTKPGADFQSHTVNYGYEMNDAADVKKYTITTTWVNGATENTISLSGNYEVGQLLKTSVTDEDGNTSIEFTNGKGQTILVRKIASQNSDTYYVYNKYGQLSYVIPPLALSKAFNQTILDNLCYQYKYDAKGRQVEKKLPGKGWEYFVYDKIGRLIMTQDANMGDSKQWMFTKYDTFGRTIYSGIYTSSQSHDSAGRAAEQNLANTATIQNENKNTGGFDANGVMAYYTNSAYPTSFTKILSVNYYDTYPQNSPARPSQILSKSTIGDNMAQTVNTKNMATASFVKNIEDDNWTKSYIWYDEKTRPIGTHTINHLGGYTKTESELDFAGVTKQAITRHKRLDSDTEKTITQTFEYDTQNRLLSQTHRVDNNPVETLSQNEYNELSQLQQRTVGGGLQEINYAYNIHGSMTKINDPNHLGSDLFGYEIKYNNPQNSTPRYNGNISEIDWRKSVEIGTESMLKRYSYHYDPLNRLTEATFSTPNATVPFNEYYNERAEYDINGNITQLKRNAPSFYGSYPEQIDDLEYSYEGNKLTSINDGSGNPTGYEGGGNTIDYDANGNMTTMPDKQINQIGYNFLNLPNSFGINNNTNKLLYLYKADGTKLRKLTHITKQNGVFGMITEYLDGFHYLTTQGSPDNQGNPIDFAYEQEAFIHNVLQIKPAPELQFVPTAEGFYDFTNNKYIYQYKDHLGNVRVSFQREDAKPLIVDSNDYYPFGMSFIRAADEEAYFGTASYKNYKFGSKELQETGMYDFGARMYMSDIGRWGVVDPLAETTRRVNPYNYALNNPVMFVDPDGRKAMATTTERIMNVPAYSGWFNSRQNFGHFEEFLQMTSFYERERGSGFGGGSNATFGQSPAYAALMSGQTYSITNRNGYLHWNTLDPANANGMLDDGSIGGMTAHSFKLQSTERTDYSGTIMMAGLSISGVLLADDVTVVGVADDVAIPPVLAVAAVAAIAAKATYEIQKIMDRQKGQLGSQYALTANVSGLYPVYTSGFPFPTGKKYLNAGDVWKYGETI